MECNYCNKNFSCKSSLKLHQKTTKYCLKLQGKNEDNKFECEYCKKIFTVKTNLISHYGTCKEKELNDNLEKLEEQLQKEFNKEKEQLQKEFNKEKEQLQKEFNKEKEKLQKEFNKERKDFVIMLKDKEEEIVELKQTVAELNGRLFTLKDDHELIKEIAKQPKSTTNNTTTNNTLNISTCLDFDNIDKIKDVIENDFNINYAINGQKGIAKFIKDKLLKDDTGKLIYVCTDPSRQIFKYKDNKGDIRKDVEAKKLTEYIVDGGLKKKTVDVASEWCTDEEGKLDMNKFDIMLDPQQSILKLKDDNNTFKKELASLTTD
jgi:hypothetical protein